MSLVKDGIWAVAASWRESCIRGAQISEPCRSALSPGKPVAPLRGEDADEIREAPLSGDSPFLDLEEADAAGSP